MTPPAWLIDKVLDAMNRYPDALRMATPSRGSKGRKTTQLRRDPEATAQRESMVMELLEVYPHPTAIERLLGLSKGIVRHIAQDAGLQSAAARRRLSKLSTTGQTDNRELAMNPR
jgi:predicted RNase H-like nuclease